MRNTGIGVAYTLRTLYLQPIQPSPEDREVYETPFEYLKWSCSRIRDWSVGHLVGRLLPEKVGRLPYMMRVIWPNSMSSDQRVRR